MNYRHAYHAGNFADVWKHLALVFCLDHLALKEAPFRVLDVFAGIGCYDLKSDEAQRSPEWQDGIGRLWAAEAPPVVRRYLEAVVSAGDGPMTYPGSPALIAQGLRRQDKGLFCELHPEDFQALTLYFSSSRNLKIECRDGWEAIRAHLPPIERRGLVLIDPPFEQKGEFARLVQALNDGLERWATGTYILWHADKDRDQTRHYRAALAQTGARLLGADLQVAAPHEGVGLVSCGLTIANPPFGLEDALKEAGAYLAALFSRGSVSKAEIAQISGRW
ncbi:23S rRNA (adenine(2030)-N(6))-methyltransferase RlmJ [Candidatus Phycosocius spiralis]|uniref:Ribosomal RNA large subunit methyltransferase J n=1 Tax=Candidatus Phycosocius spiralis TaxID=2815099 RepID=A0ABQ4PTC4_9PROT|nr:23S rRNA (adenine(2030)-N(6))-methyltransferase RlmJ [Candidatus Phycosocius spiralis]GIU66216.1 ribosomal RNA large subunit methyltransferase J [Candidatus Phycosocius spiralis]